MDSKIKEKFLFFLGKLDALKDEIYDAQDEHTKEYFENEKKEFNIVDFAVYDLFRFLLKLKDRNDGENYNKGFTIEEKKYFQDIYDSFSNYMPIENNDAKNLVEKAIKNSQQKGEIIYDRFVLLLRVIEHSGSGWEIEETPPGFYYIMNFDYEYSSKGNYLMPEYIEILLAFAKDFIEYNKNDYHNISPIIENIQNVWREEVDEFITDIERKKRY